MLLPPQQTGDLDDIPRLGLASTISSKNPIGKYPDNQKRMWSAYYAAVTFMDAQVGRILDELDQLGLRETTAVVFTSDHGYHLGDHQFWQKSNLHEQVLRVPLIVSAHGYPAGKSDSMVELVDLFPTLSELTGLRVPASVQGKSLVPVLRDPSAVVKKHAISFHQGYSLRDDRWHYMRYRDGSRELYDMTTDPGEFDNRASDPLLVETISDLDRNLDRSLLEFGIQPSGRDRKGE
jgi:iduronate 2-sulfatase